MNMRQRVFLFVRDQGESTPREVSAALGIRWESARCAMRDLVSDGKLQKSAGGTWSRRWSVVPGEKCPKDMTGKAPGTRKALRTSYRPSKCLRNLKGWPFKPKPQTALEQHWGFM